MCIYTRWTRQPCINGGCRYCIWACPQGWAKEDKLSLYMSATPDHTSLGKVINTMLLDRRAAKHCHSGSAGGRAIRARGFCQCWQQGCNLGDGHTDCSSAICAAWRCCCCQSCGQNVRQAGQLKLGTSWCQLLTHTRGSVPDAYDTYTGRARGDMLFCNSAGKLTGSGMHSNYPGHSQGSGSEAWHAADAMQCHGQQLPSE